MRLKSDGGANGGAGELFPEDRSVAGLAEAARECRACPLWKDATQTVFGEGPENARVVLVGEQPGDREDRAGKPFVGPAGALLDDAMEEAGLDRKAVYVTNAVKHFKWEPRGKWRIHKKPSAREVAACRPWLDAELRALKPDAVVLMGVTAAQALLGPQARVGTEAQPVAAPFAPFVLTTLHPAAVLRATTEEARARSRRRLVGDLAKVAAHIATRTSAGKR